MSETVKNLVTEMTNEQLFAVWFLIGAALVFWMQAGFAMVEAGFTRAKNTGNIIMKNLMDFCIGTVTFITEDGLFGGLGHGICCKESGELAPMQYGTVCEVEIKGIKKGTSGAPGEIRGAFRSLHTGRISANTRAGVFGLYAEMPTCAIYGPTEVAAPSELVIGKAKIISTLGDDGPREYEIEITSIFEPRAVNEKGFAIKVTDPALIERTGGIIQGMSGSPILQNGKLVGAVTHVMVNDPTMGYGIFIESMLKAAG